MAQLDLSSTPPNEEADDQSPLNKDIFDYSEAKPEESPSKQSVGKIEVISEGPSLTPSQLLRDGKRHTQILTAEQVASSRSASGSMLNHTAPP